MIRAWLLSTKPVSAAATPVIELRTATTGMSAPPMGSTVKTPSTNAAEEGDDKDVADTCLRERDDGDGERDHHDADDGVDLLLVRV